MTEPLRHWSYSADDEMIKISSIGRKPETVVVIDRRTGQVSDGFHTFEELYRYRLLYNAALFNSWYESACEHSSVGFRVHKSWHHWGGEPCFGGGWFIVMANLPTGQISNHYPADAWDLFNIPARHTADEWDGHTPAEAADRLTRYLQGLR